VATIRELTGTRVGIGVGVAVGVKVGVGDRVGIGDATCVGVGCPVGAGYGILVAVVPGTGDEVVVGVCSLPGVRDGTPEASCPGKTVVQGFAGVGGAGYAPLGNNSTPGCGEDTGGLGSCPLG